MTKLHFSCEWMHEPFYKNTQFDKTDIGFCACIGWGVTSWPDNPDAAWGQHVLQASHLSSNFNGLIMIDYEGQNLTNLYGSNGSAAREKAIDAMRKQINILRTTFKQATIGNYALPQSSHNWPTTKYAEDGYQFGRTGEFLNRQEVIYPLCYLLGDSDRADEFHHEAIMEMAMAAGKEYGFRVCPVVNPNVWGYPDGTPRPDYDQKVNWPVFNTVVKAVLKYKPSDIVLWQPGAYFSIQKLSHSLGGRALTAAETQTAHNEAASEMITAINILKTSIAEVQV